MKLSKYIILGAIGVLGMTSCSDWLDVNVNPDTPSAESTQYQYRLAHIEFYTNSAQCFANWRTNFACGDWTRYANGSTYQDLSLWYPKEGLVTTSYQWWFVGAMVNVDDMYKKALADENWAYAGVARVINAYGMMLMTDLHGEMPYTEACSAETAMPKYDTGRTIYMGCIKELEEGIELLSRTPEVAVDKPALSFGDYWGGGDYQKWLKFAHLLKARFLVKLSKKQAGSYLDGKYDADAILAALDNAMQSNADNMIINHTDDNGTTHDYLAWDEPVDYSPLFSVSGMNAGYYVTKMFYDNLTNFANKGIEDPRADKIIPWAYSFKTANSPAEVKWDGNWRRSLGVDMSSNIHLEGGPLRASYGVANNKPRSGDYFWIDSDNTNRWGDTVYVEQTSTCKGYFAAADLFYRRSTGNDKSRESGTFYTRVSSPTYVGTYAECCFIRAEVLFNRGDKAGAFNAYKAGVRASMEQMNEKLRVWCSEDANLATCPSYTPIEAADITNFVENALGTSGDLTLAKIMIQKRIAMMFHVEIWNDMRRYDYDPNIFTGWAIPKYHETDADGLKAVPAGKTIRRWMQCSHEYKYNTDNLQAIGYEVPGANMSWPGCWNQADDVWTVNVWWDSDQE